MEKLRHSEPTESEANSGPLSGFTVSASAQPFVVIGTAAVVVGGMVAAATGPTGWDHGSWVAAYLVLVVGVAQAGLGVGQAAVCPNVPSARRRVELASFNVGSAAIVAGTLAGSWVTVTVGAAVLLVAVIAFVKTSYTASSRSWIARAQFALLAVLAVSMPVGVVLSWLRN